MNSDKLYFNCYKRVTEEEPSFYLYIFIGGRGTGKTYSMLSNTAKNNDIIMLLKRTQTELDNSVTEQANPYKTINEDLGVNISVKKTGDNSVIVEQVGDELILKGYASALSTFGKYRGSDFSDVTMVVYDEFIPYGITKELKDEATLLFHSLETITRNRELQGKPPLKVVLLANSFSLNSDILRMFKLTEVIHKMKNNNENIYKDKERGIYLELIGDTGIRDLKKETALYRLTRGTSFYDLAIENEFTSDYFGDSKRQDLREFYPLVSYRELYFYKHKNKKLIYITNRRANCTHYEEHQKKQFLRDYGYMLKEYIDSGLCLFSDYDTKLLSFNYLG